YVRRGIVHFAVFVNRNPGAKRGKTKNERRDETLAWSRLILNSHALESMGKQMEQMITEKVKGRGMMHGARSGPHCVLGRCRVVNNSPMRSI
ncbi:MAG TPA: hypothetical protein PLZ07_02895, partial [Syntrophales bacterium]|nr:hypothetical protein [Syntrophales bacterium]